MLLLCILATGLAYSEGEIEFVDEPMWDSWYRARIVDAFDDSELRRTIVFITDNDSADTVDEFYLMREEAAIHEDEESTCYTGMKFSFSTMSLQTKAKRTNADKPPISVSFNFKKEDRDDVKVLDIPFYRTVEGSDYQFVLASVLENESKEMKKSRIENTKKIVNALVDSDEVRMRVELDSQFMVNQATDYVFNMKSTSLGTLKDKWNWLTEICEDKEIDKHIKD